MGFGHRSCSRWQRARCSRGHLLVPSASRWGSFFSRPLGQKVPVRTASGRTANRSARHRASVRNTSTRAFSRNRPSEPDPPRPVHEHRRLRCRRPPEHRRHRRNRRSPPHPSRNPVGVPVRERTFVEVAVTVDADAKDRAATLEELEQDQTSQPFPDAVSTIRASPLVERLLVERRAFEQAQEEAEARPRRDRIM